MNDAPQQPKTVRDGLWIWAQPAGSHNDVWGLPAQSKCGMMDGAR